MLHDKAALERWGWYYSPFRPAYANFGVVQLVQKAVLVGAQIFIRSPQLAGDPSLG